MALDPEQLIKDRILGKAVVNKQNPPQLLTRPADAPEPPSPIHDHLEFTALHQLWSDIHANEATSNLGHSSRRFPHWNSSNVKNLSEAQLSDRSLIGILIRTVDLLALRCDELSNRLSSAEQLVEELSNLLSEDITELRSQFIPLVENRTALSSRDTNSQSSLRSELESDGISPLDSPLEDE